MFYFARGAVALCTETAKSVRGIVNGSQLLLYDRIFGDDGAPNDYTRAYAAGGYSVVTLSTQPAAIIARASRAPDLRRRLGLDTTEACYLARHSSRGSQREARALRRRRG